MSSDVDLLTAVVLILPSVKTAPIPAGTAGLVNEEAGPSGRRITGQQTLLLFRASCFDLTVASPGAEGPSRDVWVPAGVHPFPHGIPHLCSCWDHPRPALPGESDPSPALLSERPSGSLMVRALALGLFQRRGLHTTREVCRPAGNMRLPLPCLFVSPGKGLQI